MATYKELQDQAHQLLAQAEEQRKAEMAGAIADIAKTMSDLGITLGDLRAHLKGAPADTPKRAAKSARPAKKSEPAPPKYKDPKSDATWTGHGRAPTWLKALEEVGKSREKYLIKA